MKSWHDKLPCQGYVAVLGVVACANHSPAPVTACPQDLPPSCPSSEPSYQHDVAPIFADRCVVCHSPDGSDNRRNYASYAAIYANRSAILDQVYACNMPPSGAATPTLSERATLLNWLVCGAPDN